MRKVNVVSAVVVLLAVVAGSARAVPYVLTDLGTLGGGASEAYGINSSGQVVGWANTSTGAQDAFLYSNGKMIDLGTLPGATGYTAYGINSAGLIVGVATTSTGSEAFRYTSGTMLDLGPGGTNAVNDNNQIVGWAPATGGAQHAYRYSLTGPIQDLGTLGGTSSCANSVNYNVNDTWQAVGWADTSSNAQRAFLYSNGTMTDLGWGNGSCANGINNAGQIVGQADNSSGAQHAFLGSNGTMIDLGTLPSPYNYASSAQAINDSGQTVGWSVYRYNTFPNATFYYHAVVWSGGVIQDINTGKDQQGNQLLAPGTTWTLEQATAINDSGQIAGYGLNPSGNTDAFLLTPAMPGDANVDGRVDINDLTIVLSNFGSANMNWFSGDFNGDGKVDVNDLTIVLSHFGQSLGTSAATGVAAIPEPGTLALLSAGLVGLLVYAWRKRRAA